MAKKVKTYSVGDQTREEWESHKAKIMSPQELQSYNFYIERFERAKEQRESTSKYFDELNFTDDYSSNENAKNTYLREKLNDSEVRISTGVTEKKIEVTINELLALNLQHEIMSFDKSDNLMLELGQDMTDMVSRTNKIEEDEDVIEEAIIEICTQRALFMKEVVETRKSRNNTETQRVIKKEMVSGLKVFLGDITIPAHKFNEQPFRFEYDRMHWRTAEQLYGRHKKWKNVVAGLNDNFSARTGGYAWRFGLLEHKEVEILTYISVADNERQVFVNGVMMYEPGTSETDLPWKHSGDQMTMTVLKSMSPDFAYGKPLTASAKTLQGLSNESIRLMIRKFQQSLEPPLAVSGLKTFSRDIWDPGSMANGLNKKDFASLIDHNGVNNSEFAMMDFIERKTQEFIGGGDLQQGLGDKERTTATGDLLRQKNATKQLGQAVLAVSRMKRNMTKIRVFSILEEHLNPKGKKIDPVSKEVVETFTGFTIKGVQLDNGRAGTKRIQFSNKDLTAEDKQAVFEKEEQLAKRGLNFRYRNINVKTLRNMWLNWFVVIHPKQKEGSALDKVLFQDQLQQGAAIAELTQSPLNPKVVQEDFMRKWKAPDWFQTKAPEQLAGPTQEEGEEQGDVKAKSQDILNKLSSLGGTAGGGGGGSSQMSNGIKGNMKPTVNTLAGSAS